MFEKILSIASIIPKVGFTVNVKLAEVLPPLLVPIIVKTV
jgi:hypothetical protein